MIPPEWSALPGEWREDVAESMFTPDLVAVRVDHRISPTRKVVAVLPMTRELLADTALPNVLMMAMDRHFRPWLYPDRPTWPAFEPFPRATRAMAALRSLVRRRSTELDL